MKFRPRDIFSIPNAITATGMALSIHGGLHADTPQGVAEASVGRILDLVDGKVARMTGQTSDVGALADASGDKVAMLAIMAGEYMNDVAPKPVLGAIAIRNSINAYATTQAGIKHPEMDQQSTRNGKRSVFFENASLGFFAFANLAKERAPRTARVMRGIAYTAFGVGSGYYGIPATKELIDRARS